jgi:uncharacterized protein (TIGR02001 family)
MSRKSLCALALTAFGFAPGVALADVSFNIGATTDYRYRGISQTRLQPAVQGGVDYSQGGFYAGTWASTIRWVKDSGGDGSIELDLYGGYKGEITKGLNYDVGVLAYVYPGNKLKSVPGFANADTTEVYGAVTYGPATLKYSHSLTNLFGFVDSKGSGYLDLSAAFEVMDGWTLTPHIGRQVVDNNGAANYTDASLTLSKDFKGLLVSLTAVDARTGAYVGRGKDLGKRSLVASVKYTF